ncbi:uracil-DNA glycosylase [Nitrososphaera sp.]|uniref:uracil-DNA glycosylase n=1 Tax=Nitrososphaera sp. TaxID=1971748 RepID=UPI00307E38AE
MANHHHHHHHSGNNGNLDRLNGKVIECARCPRLAAYIKEVSSAGKKRPRRFANDKYWARPLPSWGDPNAGLLIVGLAPAAHGGNRTGRMFTGDCSGDWLAGAMHGSGFASKPSSVSKDDGLVLHGAYITAAVRCAPPDNKPLPSEIAACAPYLEAELAILKNVRVVLALGRIAFGAYCKVAGLKGLEFAHGALYDERQGNGRMLLASYHPSRQNTNTGRLTWEMWSAIFQTARSLLLSSSS